MSANLPIPIEEYTQEKLTPCGLTDAQQKAWESTMSMMTWTCPGFRHLFYKLLVNHHGKHACIPTKGIPVAATDAKNILINPDRFFDYDLPERVFILGHEIVHNVYNDVPYIYRCRQSQTVPMDDGSTLPYNEQVMQQAMDYRINALLRDSKIGKPPKTVLLDDEIAKANDGISDTYKKLYEKYEGEGGLPNGGFDIVLSPGASTGQNAHSAMPNQQQWQVELKSAQTLEQMKGKGDLPGALKRMFEELLDPKVDWTDKIRGIFNRKVGSGSYNWRRGDRRFIVRDMFYPSRSGNGAGHVVVWGDTSGSIGQKELCQYLAELSSIVDDCKPTRISILWCDAKVHDIDEITDASDMATLQHKASTDGVGGGGGTSCEPVFEWIRQLPEPPEVFIGFTDGHVDFPLAEPPFTCIWASTDKEPDAYPWGDAVAINP